MVQCFQIRKNPTNNQCGRPGFKVAENREGSKFPISMTKGPDSDKEIAQRDAATNLKKLQTQRDCLLRELSRGQDAQEKYERKGLRAQALQLKKAPQSTHRRSGHMSPDRDRRRQVKFLRI